MYKILIINRQVTAISVSEHYPSVEALAKDVEKEIKEATDLDIEVNWQMLIPVIATLQISEDLSSRVTNYGDYVTSIGYMLYNFLTYTEKVSIHDNQFRNLDHLMDQEELSHFVKGAYSVFKTFCKIHMNGIPFNKANRELAVLVVNNSAIEFFNGCLPDRCKVMVFPTPNDPDLYYLIASINIMRSVIDAAGGDPGNLDRAIENISDADFLVAHFRADEDGSESGLAAGIFDCNKCGLI